MSCFYGHPSKRRFFKYIQTLLNKMLSIDVGDTETLREKVSFQPNERHLMASSRIHWRKGLYANSLSGPLNHNK